MSKRYAEPVEVEAPAGGLSAFWWRSRRYTVRRVLARWRQTGGWWASRSDAPWAGGESHEIVRVETGGGGTYELLRDLRNGTWSMYRVLD